MLGLSAVHSVGVGVQEGVVEGEREVVAEIVGRGALGEVGGPERGEGEAEENRAGEDGGRKGGGA